MADPFAGSGAVPLAAVLAGRRAVGSDLSPLAVMLATHHCWVPSASCERELEGAARRAAAAIAVGGAAISLHSPAA